MGPTYCLKSTLTLHQSTATAASLSQPSLVDLCPAHIDHVQARLRQGPPPAETLRSAQAGASLSRRTRAPCRALAAATGAPLAAPAREPRGPQPRPRASSSPCRGIRAATAAGQQATRDTSSRGHQQPRDPSSRRSRDTSSHGPEREAGYRPHPKSPGR